MVYLDRFYSRSISAPFECKLSTLCTLIYCHDLSCSISIHKKQGFVQKYSSHVSITVSHATCTQGHKFTSSCQCAKDRPFCVYIFMFFSLELYQKLNVCIYLCKYIPTRFNNIHEYHWISCSKRRTVTHVSMKQNQHRIPIKHLFLMQKKLPFFSALFSPNSPGLMICKSTSSFSSAKKGPFTWPEKTQGGASSRPPDPTLNSDPPNGTGTASSNVFLEEAQMVLTLCDSKDT